MSSPGQSLSEHRENLRSLSDADLTALISRAMRTLNLGLLAEATNVMAERKKARP